MIFDAKRAEGHKNNGLIEAVILLRLPTPERG
jgi:hypothetical protein